VTTEPERQHKARPHIMDAIRGHLAAVASHRSDCSCKLCSFAGCTYDLPCVHCKREVPVNPLLLENNRLRDAAGDVAMELESMAKDFVLWPMRVQRLLAAGEKLRAAMGVKA
jgi:hypothetical protein